MRSVGSPGLGLGVWGFPRVQCPGELAWRWACLCSGFGVCGLGFRVAQGYTGALECRRAYLCLGFRVWGLEFRVSQGYTGAFDCPRARLCLGFRV